MSRVVPCRPTRPLNQVGFPFLSRRNATSECPLLDSPGTCWVISKLPSAVHTKSSVNLRACFSALRLCVSRLSPSWISCPNESGPSQLNSFPCRQSNSACTHLALVACRPVDLAHRETAGGQVFDKVWELSLDRFKELHRVGQGSLSAWGQLSRGETYPARPLLRSKSVCSRESGCIASTAVSFISHGSPRCADRIASLEGPRSR